MLTELVLPGHANHYGTLFGPNALALLGKAAYLVATRFTRQPVVMAAVNGIDFLRPIPVGAVLRIASRVVSVRKRSLIASVTACLDAAPGAHAEDALRGSFVMVAVDETGRPCAIAAASARHDTPASAAHRTQTKESSR